MVYLIFLLPIIVIGFFSCEKSTDPEMNKPPTCEIISPLDNSEIEKGTIITIAVVAEDEDGDIDEVRFYIDEIGVYSKSLFPYNYEWNTSDETVGIHTLRAVARDDEKEESNDEITLTIIEANGDSDSIGTVYDINGNQYGTVKIGNQWWMAENLKVINYRNGDPIPNVADSSEWESRTYGAYCIYDNNYNNTSTYGYLYNGYAVKDSRNIAPEGWRVPRGSDWDNLVDHLGGKYIAGGPLKETGTVHWNPPNPSATNESGFSALPGGKRNDDNSYFEYLGQRAYFWTTTFYAGNKLISRRIYYNNSTVGITSVYREYGLSVRCVKE